MGSAAKRYMDAGELVPDEVIVGMITQRVADGDARDGFLLDGFPRNEKQADALAMRCAASIATSPRRC